MPAEAQSWTCDHCNVTVQWMPGHEANARQPEHWYQEGDELLCLGCRRDMAAESATDGMPDDMPAAERVKLRSQARVEFEINRDPGRPNNRIATTCHTTAAVVKKARARMGVSDAVAL